MGKASDTMFCKGWFRYFLIISGLTLFYVLTSPVNRSEAEDAYDYAWQVETVSGGDLFDSHHLLFFPLMKAVYVAFSTVSDTRAFDLMCLISAMATAGMLVLLYRMMRVHLAMRPVDALISSGIAGSLYGVWRYAAEAEVYALSGLLAVAVIYIALDQDGMFVRPLPAALIAVLGIGFHIMNILPAFSVGLICVFRRQWRTAFIYGGAIVLLLIAMGCMALALGWDPTDLKTVSPVAYEGGWLNAKSYARSLVGMGSCILSSQFVFGFEGIRDLAVSTFPGMMLSEELYFGTFYGGVFALAGSVLASMVILAAFVLLWRTFKGSRENSPPAAKCLFGIVFVWMLAYMAIIFRYDPAAPEFWVQMVPGVALIAFSSVSMLKKGSFPRAPCAVFFVLLFMHNFFIGILPLKNREADYNAVKAARVLSICDKNDLVLSSDNPVFYHYLRYVCPAEVIDVYSLSDANTEDLVKRIQSINGTVYAFEDLGSPAANMRLRMPDAWERARRTGEILGREDVVIVDHLATKGE